MQKHWVVAIIITFTLISIGSISLAQSIFNFGNSKSKAPEPTTPTVKKMSPSEFQSTVKSMGQQNLNKLSAEVQQHIQSTSQPLSPPPSSMSTNIGTSTNNTTTTTTTTTTVPTSPSTATPPPSSLAPGSAPDLSTLQTHTRTPAPATPKTSQQNDVYTGFGTGNTNKAPANGSNAPAKSSGGSGGWNINY